MRKYGRAYNELLFDEYYDSVPDLKEAVKRIDGFVTHDDEQVSKILEMFKGQGRMRTDTVKEVVSKYLIAEMSNWDKCKQIYDFDKTLYDELSVTSTDKIPADILSKMPYPTFYIKCSWDEIHHESPYLSSRERLEWDFSECVHTDGALVSYVDDVLDIRFYSTSTVTFKNRFNGQTIKNPPSGIFCWGNTYTVSDYKTVADILADDVESSNLIESENKLAAAVASKKIKDSWDYYDEVKDVMHVLAAIIYIVSKESDMESFYIPREGKHKKKYADLSSAQVTRVGYRIGRALGKARSKVEMGDSVEHDDRNSRGVMPHIRRAHWHCYWIGPKDNPTDIVVHWLAPIVVNGNQGEVIPTIHEARKLEGREI